MLNVDVALPSGRSDKFLLPQSSKVEDLRVLAQKSFQLLEACGCKPACESCSISGSCRNWRWRPCDSCWHRGKGSGNRTSFRVVLLWRWPACHLGVSKSWWWQPSSPRSAERCPTASSNAVYICCHPGRRVSCDLGLSKMGRWQLKSCCSVCRCLARCKVLQGSMWF